MDIIFIAVMAYIGTNIDDIFITTLLFGTAGTSTDRGGIVAGRYLGTFTLLGISLLGAKGVQTAIGQYSHLLGAIPLAMGLSAAYSRIKHKDEKKENTPQVSGSVMISTAMMTIASGGDNIGVYIPLLAGADTGKLAVFTAVFGVMTAVWCFVSYHISSAYLMKSVLEKHKNAIVPAIYILLGLYVLFI
ncbi:MAG: cadmium resistance transporter [Oscillospiraceae bacterium]|nr:cadmium resistance transporter [Oscillospiraceae bacterium]